MSFPVITRTFFTTPVLPLPLQDTHRPSIKLRLLEPTVTEEQQLWQRSYQAVFFLSWTSLKPVKTLFSKRVGGQGLFHHSSFSGQVEGNLQLVAPEPVSCWICRNPSRAAAPGLALRNQLHSSQYVPALRDLKQAHG